LGTSPEHTGMTTRYIYAKSAKNSKGSPNVSYKPEDFKSDMTSKESPPKASRQRQLPVKRQRMSTVFDSTVHPTFSPDLVNPFYWSTVLHPKYPVQPCPIIPSPDIPKFGPQVVHQVPSEIKNSVVEEYDPQFDFNHPDLGPAIDNHQFGYSLAKSIASVDSEAGFLPQLVAELERENSEANALAEMSTEASDANYLVQHPLDYYIEETDQIDSTRDETETSEQEPGRLGITDEDFKDLINGFWSDEEPTLS
jgi:hypothetical protein